MLPFSKLRFPGQHTEERRQPPRAVARLSGNCPAQAGVESMMAASIGCTGMCWGWGCRGHVSVSGPGSASRAVGPQANHVTRNLMALLQGKGNSALVFYQHLVKAFLK